MKILWEGEGIVVIDKPAGLDCQASRADRPSLAHWLGERYGFQGLVHRLDFNTSGVMVCATGPASARRLTELLRGGGLSRIYRALVKGRVTQSEGRLDFPIEGAEASTRYKVLELFPNASDLELTLDTGRKHQIRRHMLEAGHPVLGDTLYKSKGSHLLFRRPALHSWKLKIIDREYVAPLPDDMVALGQRFRKSQQEFRE